jgi:hypothetical protein
MLDLFLVENGDGPLADLLCHHTRNLEVPSFLSADVGKPVTSIWSSLKPRKRSLLETIIFWGFQVVTMSGKALQAPAFQFFGRLD